MSSQPTLRPFISYAREDSEKAVRLFEDLRREGAVPWMDQFNLLGGQNFDRAIREALYKCSHFIALISEHSISKRGYVQRELREALRLLDEFPPDAIFVVPVRLDDSIPADDRLRALHWIDLHPSYQAGLNKLLESLGIRNEASGGAPQAERLRDESNSESTSHARFYQATVLTQCGHCKRAYESQGGIAVCPYCQTKQYD
jgi:hypothetical protein